MQDSKKLKELCKLAFGNGDLSRDKINFAVKCPACKETRANKKKLIVRLDDGRYHCWVCGIKGKSIISYICKTNPGLSEKAKSLGFKPTRGKEQEDFVTLPKDFVVLSEYEGRDPDIISVKKNLAKRGLSDSDISRWRILACSKGSYRRRAIIPSFDVDGNLNYYVARCIDQGTKPKYKNPTAKKKNIIFNEIDIVWSKPIILVEGVFDAIKCPENCIPILGSQLSKDSLLFKRLVTNQSEVYLSLDQDMKSKAYDIASMLTSSGCPTYVSFAEEGKDIGDMDKKSVIDLLRSSVSYSRSDSIYHRISNIKSGSII